MFSAAKRQMNTKYLPFTSLSKNISDTHGLREIAAYLQDEIPNTIKPNIKETLFVALKKWSTEHKIFAVLRKRNVSIKNEWSFSTLSMVAYICQ